MNGWGWQKEREEGDENTGTEGYFVAVSRFHEGELQQLKGLHQARILNLKMMVR